MRFNLLRRPVRFVLLALSLSTAGAPAQWQMLNSNTTASLRGIDSVMTKDGAPSGIAWASGANGTVLRTLDGGDRWTACAVPQGAATLDFRGIQAWDAQNAIVMSSGSGNLSRLYGTADGCKTWKLLLANPDEDGFWDAVRFPTRRLGFVLGDPVASPRKGWEPQFALYVTEDGGAHFRRWSYKALEADPESAGVFAASNSAMLVSPAEGPHGWIWFASGGKGGAHVFQSVYFADVKSPFSGAKSPDGGWPIAGMSWETARVPLARGAAAGGFSIAARGHETDANRDWIYTANLVAVGGDYTRPDASRHAAVYSVDGGKSWHASSRPPSGYRSAVAYDEAHQAFIAVGPTGTDASFDGGKTFSALQPLPGDDPGANRNWNSLSLPFVVGSDGRIGRLEAGTFSFSR